MKRNLSKKLCILLSCMMVTGLLAGCGDVTQENNTDNSSVSEVTGNNEVTEESNNNSESAGADSLTALTGKKKDESSSEEKVIPSDYVYTLDEKGFLDIGDTQENIDDNYRNYYEIFVLSFYDSDGDGVGDINGVTEKLDYIQEMGFDGIWLMPVMSSPSYHKYDTDDYYLIDPSYGTNEDFENLLTEAHKRGINVVIDFVINHSSSEHPWFKEACDYLRTLGEDEEPDASVCPYVDYYHFSRTWDSGYCIVEGTDWYYEGQFNYTQPDLNFDCEALRGEIEDICDFWVGMGVDGFRVDAAAHFEEGKIDYNKDVLSWLYNYCLDINPDFYMVSEVWLNEKSIADYYVSGTPSFFNFDAGDTTGKLVQTAKGTKTAAQFAESMLTYQTDYSKSNPDYIDAVFITNHDMSRVANLLVNDEDAMKMACGLMMTMQGSTFVYYGEEIGMKSAGSSDENKRISMFWSATDTTGITDGPENADSITSSFAAEDEQASDPDSILNYYRRALQMRCDNPAIARGRMEIVEDYTSDNIAAIKKTYGDDEVLIVYNTGTEETKLDISSSEYSGWNISGMITLHPWEEVTFEDGTLDCPARSIVVLSRAE